MVEGLVDWRVRARVVRGVSQRSRGVEEGVDEGGESEGEEEEEEEEGGWE